MNTYKGTWRLRFAALAALLGAMWLVYLIDVVTPGGGSAAGIGVVPRTWIGLRGIPAAPFIHVDLRHLLANTIPLVVFGTLIVLGGARQLLFVSLVSALVAGGGTWLFGAGNAQHVGASGVVFGFFGYLVFRVLFDRRLLSAIVTLVVATLYGGAMALSLVPAESISWSGHFFGFLGGLTAARMRHPR